MDLVRLNETGSLFLSPHIDDWELLHQHGITAVIDLDGDLDEGVPTMPNHMLYVYFPIYDDELPDLAKLHAVARLGASLVESGHRVLSHCGMGLNRSALMAGLILTYLGMRGDHALTLLQDRRARAPYNENFDA